MKKRLALLALPCALSSAFAQNDRGSLTGTVTDLAGARISDASVVAHNTATGADSLTRSNEAGIFTITALPVGNYTLRFAAPGFAAQEIQAASLDAGQIRKLAIQLSIEAVASQVEVTAADSGLATSSAEIGGVVHGSQAQDLPLNGRN